MPRPPSKHGLERKFKSWRKGKSEKSNSKGGSLKHQLRGLERLLSKIPQEDSKRRDELENQMEKLKGEMERRQSVAQQKENAKKSHGIRFLERQRLVRMQRKAVQADDADWLRRIALDQVYVAHFPSDVKYMPLFRKGIRIVDDSKMLFRRALTRKRILTQLKQENNRSERVAWISRDQYERLPIDKEWTVDQERSVFGKREKGSLAANTLPHQPDDRFALSSTQRQMLEAASAIDLELDEQQQQPQVENRQPSKGTTDEILVHDAIDEVEDDESAGPEDHGIDNDDDDDADPLGGLKRKKLSIPVNGETHPITTKEENGDATSKSINAEDESATETQDATKSTQSPHAEKQKNNQEETSDSSSDSSSSDDNSDDDDDDSSSDESGTDQQTDEEEKSASITPTLAGNDNDDVDDFFMPASDENVFERARKERADLPKGNKSQGWATQRQRPGQWKKRRVRR